MGDMEDRIEFVRQRDGDKEADKYAESSLAAYVTAASMKGRYSEQVEALLEYFKARGLTVRFIELVGTSKED